jgi:hypothetical protein
LARDPIVVDEAAFAAALTRRLGRVNVGAKMEADKAQLYLLRDHPVQVQGGPAPATLSLFKFNRRRTAQLSDGVERALRQSWTFPEARELFNDCGHSLIFADILSWSLPHDLRRKIVVNGLLALLETSRVDLVYWLHSEQMLSPEDVQDRYSETEMSASPVFGFLNVRIFKGEGETLMDTVGLSAIGLRDLQIHYRDLDPDQVFGFLRDLGSYVLENGDVIQDGHTVDAPETGRWKWFQSSRWTCRWKQSLLPPERPVIDIDPGPKFAARPRP